MGFLYLRQHFGTDNQHCNRMKFNMETQSRFEQVAPDQLRIREGGGCLSIFGIPFFIAGIFTTLIGLRIIPVENEADIPSWSWIIIVLMGLIFTGVGGVLVFGRRWVILDISRGTLVKSVGLLVPMRQTELSLHLYDAVLLRFDPGDSDSADRYIIVLRAKDGSDGLVLYGSTQYGNSHEQAVLVAEFLKLPLVDASTDHESVIDSHLVDQSFHGEPGEKKDDYPAATRPAVLQTQIQETASEVQIIIPDKVFKPVKLIRYIFPAFILIIIVPPFVSFFRQTDTPDIVEKVFIVIAILFLGIIPLFGLVSSIIRARKSRTIVTANAEGVKIEYRGILQTKTNHIPVTDILGMDYSTTQTVLGSVRTRMARHGTRNQSLDYKSMGYDGSTPRWLTFIQKLVKSKGIVVKCRSGLVTFGAGLPDEEVYYLFTIVKRVIGER